MQEYIMLSGRNNQYRDMYASAADTAAEKLFFRVMIPDEKREILVSGSFQQPLANSLPGMQPVQAQLQTGGSHLTCFVGGMYALGSKIFNRPDDLKLAAKLTDGCIWAYESTATGIMPETFQAAMCDDNKHCPWNETRWWELLDPGMEWRQSNYDAQLKQYEELTAAREKAVLAKAKDVRAGAAAETAAGEETEAESKEDAPQLRRRALAQLDAEAKAARSDDESLILPTKASAAEEPSQPDMNLIPLWSPPPPDRHEDVVAEVLATQHLPEGMVRIPDARYILRPEALESVFYMHRVTGDPYWREKGWKMVEAVLKHTRTKHGHSGIADVTRADGGGYNDSMESFWLAETLKYAYLLFCDEDEWSLDEWVLNTEAHLLRRPDAGEWTGSA